MELRERSVAIVAALSGGSGAGRESDPLDSDVAGSMAGFAYRCPNTGLNVQGFIADDPGDDGSYVPVTCIICTRVHLVDPRSGKVVGVDDESAANT